MKNLLMAAVMLVSSLTAMSQTYVYIRNMSNCTIGYEVDALDNSCNQLATYSGSVSSCGTAVINIGTYTKHQARVTFTASAGFTPYRSNNFTSCAPITCTTVPGTCSASSGAAFYYFSSETYIVTHLPACSLSESPCY